MVFTPVKKAIPAFLLCALAWSGPGCSPDDCGWTKSGFLDRFDDLMADIDKVDYGVGDERWQRFDERFTNLVDVCYEKYEPELTPKEKRHFWAGMARYYYKRFGKAGLRELKRQSREIESILRDLPRDEQFRDLIDEIGNDFRSLFR